MEIAFSKSVGQERASDVLAGRIVEEGSTYTDSEVNKKWPARRNGTIEQTIEISLYRSGAASRLFLDQIETLDDLPSGRT